MKTFLSLLSVLAINASVVFTNPAGYSPSAAADDVKTETMSAVNPISNNKKQQPIQVKSELSSTPHTGSSLNYFPKDTTSQMNQSSPQNNESKQTVPSPQADTAKTPTLSGQQISDTTNAIAFNNVKFPIGDFHGNGNVPGDGHIYRWDDAPVDNWFLLERSTPQANMVWKLQVGSTISANNQTYHVYSILNGVSHSDPRPLEALKSNGGILIQTCEQPVYNSPLTFVLAK